MATLSDIAELYQRYLGRAPGPGEAESWGGGGNLSDIEQGFIGSQERTDQVSNFYRNLLGREPGPGEVGSWTSGGGSLADIERGFRGSQEFSANQPTPQAFFSGGMPPGPKSDWLAANPSVTTPAADSPQFAYGGRMNAYGQVIFPSETEIAKALKDPAVFDAMQSGAYGSQWQEMTQNFLGGAANLDEKRRVFESKGQSFGDALGDFSAVAARMGLAAGFGYAAGAGAAALGAGSTATGATIGATSGATNAAISGENVGEGALVGGLTGGALGYAGYVPSYAPGPGAVATEFNPATGAGESVSGAYPATSAELGAAGTQLAGSGDAPVAASANPYGGSTAWPNDSPVAIEAYGGNDPTWNDPYPNPSGPAAPSGGGAPGTGGASGGSAATTGAGTALSRILDGTATDADWLSIAGTAGSTALGYLGSRDQTQSLERLSREYMAMGAPSRARYESSFDPSFKLEDMPGYQQTLDTSYDTMLRRLSTKGNPYGNPGGLAEAMKYVTGNVGLPALQQYRSANANAGGLSRFADAAPGAATAAIGSQANIYNVGGAAIADLTQPRRRTLADYINSPP